MYFQTNTNQLIQVATSEAIALAYTALDVTCCYIVNSQNTRVETGPLSQTGYLDNSFREILPAPHEVGVQHSIKSITIVNTDSIAHIITVRLVDTGNPRKLYRGTLEVGYTLIYDEFGWTIYNEKGIKLTKSI